MAVCNLQFFSNSIEKQDYMNVIVPDSGRGPFPVLYLLHGLSDDYGAWLRLSNIARYVNDKKLIVVMPQTHRFFYVNDPRPGGLAYEDHIMKDVIGTVDRLFPTIRARRGRAIAGLSMGGYGSMMLALKHPGKFACVSSHSSAFHFTRPEIVKRQIADRDIHELSEAAARRENDVFHLASKLKKTNKKLAIRFDCGVDDFLIESSRAFDGHLSKIGLKHEYTENPGEHDWAYWDEHIQDTIAFVMKHMAKK